MQGFRYGDQIDPWGEAVKRHATGIFAALAFVAAIAAPAASWADAGILEQIKAQLDRIEARLAGGPVVLPPVVVPPRPVDPVPVDPLPAEPPAQTGDTLMVWSEVRVTTPATFAGFFTVRVKITVTPIGGGGRATPVEMIANGVSLGLGPTFVLEPGSYHLTVLGGSTVPGARQSVVARPGG